MVAHLVICFIPTGWVLLYLLHLKWKDGVLIVFTVNGCGERGASASPSPTPFNRVIFWSGPGSLQAIPEVEAPVARHGSAEWLSVLEQTGLEAFLHCSWLRGLSGQLL